MVKIFISFIACLALAQAGVAEVELPGVLSDGMVLQRELPVPIWGTANPGESVSVSFAGQKVRTEAGADGKWLVKLKPLKTSAKGKDMTVSGMNTIRLKDVLVGEVWLCSGQSNMAGCFVKSKGRAIEPEVFEMDLSKFRFNTPRGWMTLDERTQAPSRSTASDVRV